MVVIADGAPQSSRMGRASPIMPEDSLLPTGFDSSEWIGGI